MDSQYREPAAIDNTLPSNSEPGGLALPAAPDLGAVAGEVNSKFARWKDARRPYEIQWFVNAAFLRGNHYVHWNEALGSLEAKAAPPHRVRLAVNHILPKIRARIAKFVRNRMQPVVIPASTDREDRLNARATQKVLHYLQRKLGTEQLYKEALLWSQQCGKGFWWVRWDENKVGRTHLPDPFTGEMTLAEAPIGDVSIEVGSPFEVFVGDSGIMDIAKQPEIMRVKMRPVDEVKQRYPEHANTIQADAGQLEIFQYERQIAQLGARKRGYAGNTDDKKLSTHVAVKEHFMAPCPKYPKGRYVVVVNSKVVKYVEMLPFNFGDMNNPYPVVEFPDIQTAGQFWPTTHIEQMISLQEEYNHLRSRLAEHLRLMVFPKIIVPQQFQMTKEAWTSEAGQIVRYLAMPGMPGPQVWHPPNVASDLWKLLDTIKKELDDTTNIFPAMQGGVGQASSGFQTNLLQEAADSVHAPDIRTHEIAFEDAAFKMRRLMKLGYDSPRLVSITGRGYEPDVFEFSSDQIDENADIIIQTGSALSNSPATRSQQVFELYNSGLLGDPASPETRRTALGLLSLDTQDEMQEIARRDEEQARLETLEIERGIPVEMPKPWEDHDVHWRIHTDQLKNPATRSWPPEAQRALVVHVVLHGRYINPMNAMQIAQEFGLNEIMDMFPPPPPPPGAPGGQPPMPPQPPMAGGGGGLAPQPPMDQPPPPAQPGLPF